MHYVTITFNVNGQIVSRDEEDVELLSDSIDLVKARFNFSPEWQGYTKTAIFKRNAKKPYSRVLVDDMCMVPPEAIKKANYMSVSVFGVSGTQLVTATDQIVPIKPSGYTDDSTASPAPAENIYQQIVTLMQRQAVDAVHAETAQEEAKSHAEQTGEDRIATGEDREATGVNRSAINTALLGFAETTLPDAIQAVENKADTEIARVGQAGDEQVLAVETEGAKQIAAVTEQADRMNTELEGTIVDAQTAKSDLDDPLTGAIILAREVEDDLTNPTTGAIKKAEDAERSIQDAIANNQIVTLPVFNAHKEDYIRQQQLPHFNHAAQEYVNLDQFWNNLRNGKIYTSEFNQPSVSMASTGVKLDDNSGLVMEPSTNTVAGRDDYSKIGLFMPIEVNAYVDENDDYHVIAIEGDGRFKRDGTMGDVYVMNMVGYQKYVSTDAKWRISYSDTMHAGFEVIDEAVKPDGTIRPYLLHAKHVAGRNPHENNNLASISGVYPEFVNMSHNGQITEFRAKGIQYSGKTSHDDCWVQLIMWLKYAMTNSDTIMRGCQSYYLQYVNLVAETGVKRVIITNAQANALVIGSTVSIGDYDGSTKTDDRQQVRNYNKANRVNITSIEDIGNGNSAVYVNSGAFDTTLTTTITTYPWNSGGCDNVLGVDGSPYSNSSGKEPFVINKIEMMVGGYEILQNLIILNNAVDNRIDVYANYDCKTYATSITPVYDLVGQLAQTNNTWKYGSKIVKPNLHPSVILITEAEASSTTGTGDGIYTNPPSAGGTRAWRSLGTLSHGARCGLRSLRAYDAVSAAFWSVLGRLSATGRSRRRAGVN